MIFQLQAKKPENEVSSQLKEMPILAPDKLQKPGKTVHFMQENTMVDFGDGNWQNIRKPDVRALFEQKIASADKNTQVGFLMHDGPKYGYNLFFSADHIQKAEFGDAGDLSITLSQGTKLPYPKMIMDQEELVRQAKKKSKKKG